MTALRPQPRPSSAAIYLDTIDLFGALLEAASDLRCAGDTIYAGNLMGATPTDHVMADARRAAEKALAAINAYEAGK